MISEISLELGRFQVTEGLFHPEAWGLDNPGIQKLVHKAIQVNKKKKKMKQNVVKRDDFQVFLNCSTETGLQCGHS